MTQPFDSNNVPMYTIVCSSEGIIRSIDEELSSITKRAGRAVEHVLELISSADFSQIKELIKYKTDSNFVHFAIKDTELYFNLWSQGGNYNIQLNEYSLRVSIGRFPSNEEKELLLDPNTKKLRSLSFLTEALIETESIDECIQAAIDCIKQLFQKNSVFYYNNESKKFQSDSILEEEADDFKAMLNTMLTFPAKHLKDLLENYDVGKHSTNPIYVDQPNETQEVPQSDMGFYAVKNNKINFGLFIIITNTIPTPTRVNWLNLVCNILAQRLCSLKAYEELRIKQEKEQKGLLLQQKILSFLCHEIKEPLSSILEIINKEIEEEKTASFSFLSTLKNSAHHLQQLTLQFLDYKNLENEGTQGISKEFPFHETIKSVVDNFSFEFDSKNIVSDLRLSDKIPSCLIGDKMQLNRIINNLISNAIKFTENGFISISVDVKSATATETTLVFKIEDSGVGIPEELLNTIVSPFEQGGENSKTSFEGWGLGLSIVQQILKQHDSSLQITSKKGKGSAFCFELVYGIPNE